MKVFKNAVGAIAIVTVGAVALSACGKNKKPNELKAASDAVTDAVNGNTPADPNAENKNSKGSPSTKTGDGAATKTNDITKDATQGASDGKTTDSKTNTTPCKVGATFEDSILDVTFTVTRDRSAKFGIAFCDPEQSADGKSGGLNYVGDFETKISANKEVKLSEATDKDAGITSNLLCSNDKCDDASITLEKTKGKLTGKATLLVKRIKPNAMKFEASAAPATPNAQSFALEASKSKDLKELAAVFVLNMGVPKYFKVDFNTATSTLFEIEGTQQTGEKGKFLVQLVDGMGPPKYMTQYPAKFEINPATSTAKISFDKVEGIKSIACDLTQIVASRGVQPRVETPAPATSAPAARRTAPNGRTTPAPAANRGTTPTTDASKGTNGATAAPRATPTPAVTPAPAAPHAPTPAAATSPAHSAPKADSEEPDFGANTPDAGASSAGVADRGPKDIYRGVASDN